MKPVGQVALALLGVLSILAAGCVSGPAISDGPRPEPTDSVRTASPRPGSEVPGPVVNESVTQNSSTPPLLLLYSFSGTLAGASLIEPVRSDPFLVPGGTLALPWRLALCPAGLFRLTIVRPDGSVDSSSGELVGSGPLGGGLCPTVDPELETPEGTKPPETGKYEVEYWVNGQSVVDFCIFAVLDDGVKKFPACPSSGGDQTGGTR